MNVIQYFQAMAPKIKGKSIHELFPAHFIQNMPFAKQGQFCCMECGKPMSDNEMKPPGRITPRAICPRCYGIMTAQTTAGCWVCGNYIGHEDTKKTDKQRQAPHEIHHRLCGDNGCKFYFSLCSAYALGLHTGVKEHVYKGLNPSPEQCQNRQPYHPHHHLQQHHHRHQDRQPHTHTPVHADMNVIDVDYVEVEPQRIEHKPVRAITYQPMQTVDEMFNNTMSHEQHREKVPAHHRRH